MSSFKVNQVIQITVPEKNNSEFYRIVWLNVARDLVWLIQIPFSNYHCKAPKITSLTLLEERLKNFEIVISVVKNNPLWEASDEEILKRFEQKNDRCPALDLREMRWGWIKDLVMENSLADIFEGKLITRWVNEKEKQVKQSRAILYDAIHRYYAGGCCVNALLGNWSESGGRGKKRVQNQKLGRPNAFIKANKLKNDTYYLEESDKEKLQFAWKHFLPGKTVYRAFLEMTGVFYKQDVKIVNGAYVPDFLPQARRPTINQFKTWGPIDDPAKSAWRVKLGPNEWCNNYKGISGSAKDGIVSLGQMAYCDTTSNDAHIVSISSRLIAVGTLNRLMIYEAKSELIMGLHCGFEAPSARTFLMAVENAATSKVKFYERFGIKISEADAPALAVKVYLGDNGEYRSEAVFKALNQFGSIVELAASGMASSKGPIEGNHHVVHARLDHTLDGTTHGRQRRRGEKSPVLTACLTYYEYMAELLKEVLFYNNEEIVDHLLTIEMRKENVQPTRIEIYRWLVKVGYVVDFTPDVTTLRAHLLPALPAVLTETGIYLLREDVGGKAEIIVALRYMSKYLLESGLLSDVRRNGNKRVTVRGAPEDPSNMWLVTDEGLKELEWTNSDPLLKQQATVQDCIAIQVKDKIKNIEEKANVDQKRSDIECVREATLINARSEKKEAMQALPKRPSKAELISGIDENRRREIALIDEKESKIEKKEELKERIENGHLETNILPLQVELDPARLALLKYLKSVENK